MGNIGPRFTIRQIELFCAAARTGSFTAAAAELSITSTAVATAVDELERILGQQLLQRSRARGVTPTLAGRHVLDHGVNLIRNASELQSRLADNGSELTGPIAIGCNSSLSAIMLPVIVRSFAVRHPRVDLTLIDGNMDLLLPMLARGDLDLAIGYRFDPPVAIESAPMFDTSVHVLLSESHPLAASPNVSLEQLREDPLILLNMPHIGNRPLALLRLAGVTPHIALRTPNLDLARSFVADGLGYTLLMRRDADPQVDSGLPVVAKPLRPAAPRETVTAMWRSDSSRSRILADDIGSLFRTPVVSEAPVDVIG